VSEGPYASLNFSTVTGDTRECVAENRRLACDRLGLDADRLAANRQVHSTDVRRARAGESGKPGDGLVTDEPGVPVLAMTADCVPIAIARMGERRGLAVLHAGWRGLAGGIVAAGVEALGVGETAAVIGPSIGPCCYEVGEEVGSLFDRDLTVDGRLDLWTAVERALRSAGVTRIDRVDLCTRCNDELFFSYRRDGREHGVQGVIGALA